MFNAGRNDLLRGYVDREISRAETLLAEGYTAAAFHHLERAHILGQSLTGKHTRVHWRMLKLGWASGDWREILGQLLRIVGAATKTPFGIYPKGNTGRANIYFFQSVAIPDDLEYMLRKAGRS